MKKWFVRNRLFVFAITMLALATWVQENAKAEEKPKPNPLRIESFPVTRDSGREQTIMRIYDTETGYVCYLSSWTAVTENLRCGEVDGTDSRTRIRKRYEKD